MNQFAMSLPEAQCYEVFDRCEKCIMGSKPLVDSDFFFVLGLWQLN